MTREKWMEHLKEAGEHDRSDCPDCKARRRTYRANLQAKAIRSVYDSLGMKRVRGALGGIYYE